MGRNRRHSSRPAVSASALFGLVAALALGGCSGGLPKLPKLSDLDPFKEKQQPLPGKRVSILPTKDRVGGAELANAGRPVLLPAAFVNDNWAQPGGTPNNAPGHLMVGSSLRRVWSRDAGAGSGKVGRLTAGPVVYGGRIYTLDAASRVSAFSLSGGAASWRRSFVPENERGLEGYGGGLAVDNGRLYVATGFGRVAALDPGSGKPIWEKSLRTPLRASPTAVADRLFVVSSEGIVFCLSGVDGSELWQFRGLPETTRLIMSPSPAVDGDVVAVPFPNGDVVALRVSDGTPLWQERLARSRTTTSFAAMSDAARPAISNGVVFAVSHGGRFYATRQTDGERVWSLEIGSTQAPWVAGNNVFVVDTQGQLMAVDRETGQLVWTTQLPGAKVWSGPVLAGNQLWLTSNKGQLIGVEATVGKVTSKLNVGEPVYIAPVVAAGGLYVLTDRAKLVAYR